MNQTAINRADVRTRFIFDDMPVRGLHVRLENEWQHIVKQKNYPAAIRRALGSCWLPVFCCRATSKTKAR